jgi:hypothetical protein
MELLKEFLPLVRYACYTILGGFAAFVAYKRIANKVITYQEVLDWAKTVCKPGDICHISRVSDIPEQVQNQIRRELGAQQIINGFNYNGSVFVTITDSQNNIKETSYFMGKELDKELSNALATEIEHRIAF